MIDNRITGIALAIAASVFWGIIGPIAKALSQMGMSMITVCIIRSSIVAAMMFIILAITGKAQILKLTKNNAFIMTLAAFFTVFCSGGGYLMSVAYLSVPQALILHYAFPLVTLVGSSLLLHEYPTKLQFLAGFLIIAGIWIALYSENASSNNISLYGILWGILGVIGTAGQSLLGRYIGRRKDISRTALLFHSNLIGALMLLLFKWSVYGLNDFAHIPQSAFALLPIQALLGGLMASGSYFLSLKYIQATTASLICTGEVVVATLITALALKIPPTTGEITGAIIIITAIALTTIKPPQKTNDRP